MNKIQFFIIVIFGELAKLKIWQKLLGFLNFQADYLRCACLVQTSLRLRVHRKHPKCDFFIKSNVLNKNSKIINIHFLLIFVKYFFIKKFFFIFLIYVSFACFYLILCAYRPADNYLDRFILIICISYIYSENSTCYFAKSGYLTTKFKKHIIL